MIEEVQIGLDTANKQIRYYDTGNLVEDLDCAYKVVKLTAIGEENIYFEEYENAQKFVKDLDK